MLRKLFKLKPRQKTKQNITSVRTTSNQTDNTSSSATTWFMMGYLLAPRSSGNIESNTTAAASQPFVSTSFQPLAKSPLEPVATANQQDHQTLNQSTVVPELVDKGGSDWWSSEGSSWSDSGDCGGGGDSGSGGCD